MEKEVSLSFTREQIELLQSAFEVLMFGGGVYGMLRLPEVVVSHRKLFHKFDNALKEMRSQDGCQQSDNSQKP